MVIKNRKIIKKCFLVIIARKLESAYRLSYTISFYGREFSIVFVKLIFHYLLITGSWII